jgi:hypothetical protein
MGDVVPEVLRGCDHQTDADSTRTTIDMIPSRAEPATPDDCHALVCS